MNRNGSDCLISRHFEKPEPMHLGIFADYATTLRPDEGIGVFVHQLLSALRKIEPEIRITFWVHPGEEYLIDRLLRRQGLRVEVYPPVRWRWLGWWLDAVAAVQNLIQNGCMSRMSNAIQQRLILGWKNAGGAGGCSWRSWLIRIGILLALTGAVPLAWLTALLYHVVVHGLLRSLALPARLLLRGWTQDNLPPPPPCDVWLLPLGRCTRSFDAPEVVVLWDVAHHHVSGIFDAEMAEITDSLFAARVARAAFVICAAESVHQADLERLYPHAADRIRVIPLAIPEDMHRPTPDEQRRVRQRYRLNRPFLFYPAALRGHKNHRTLIRALHRIRQHPGHDLELICTGKGAIPADVAAVIAELRLENHVRFLGLVDRSELRAMYALAEATVVPSLHEGYGLPVLEALACGGLLTCSDLPSFRELLDGCDAGVLFFDPRDADAVAEAVVRTLREKAWRAAMQRQALHRLAARTWDDVARDYLTVLRQAAARPSAGPLVAAERKAVAHV